MKKNLLLTLSIYFLIFNVSGQKNNNFNPETKYEEKILTDETIVEKDILLKKLKYKKTTDEKSIASFTSSEKSVQILNEKIETEINISELASVKQSILSKYKSTIDTKGDATFVSEADSLALVSFYNSTNGDSWTNKTNWLTGPVNSWFGIDINGGLVTSILLTGNNLTGTIPAELGQLTSLTSLYLDQNQITGEIPSELGNLNNVTELCLWVNQLSGSIPPELGNLTNVSYLDLDENQLSGSIPAELGNLTNLTNLWLDVNQLSGEIPIEISNLAKLEMLGLAINQLTGAIPAELGNLSNLTFLALYENQLSGVIPTELNKLSNLEKLYLFDNQLTGTIPTELSSLSNLTTLWLYSNELSGTIPSMLSSLSNLQTLYLQGNQLSGSIPTELGSLSNLTRLYLGNNQLSGTIPSILGSLTLLERLDLQNNQLTGAVPTEINNLNNMFLCYINGNSFNDLPILTSTNIQYLYSHENEFTFGDLETSDLNFSTLTYVTYAPQSKIAAPTKTDNGNNTTTLTFTTDGTGNTYQWYRNGEELIGETSNTITVDNTAESFYYCAVSNANYPDLVLETEYAEFNMSASHGIYEEEYNALVMLYNSTIGDNWTDNTNWLGDENVDQWYGITVVENHVTEIQLSNNNLKGNIPEELGVLNSITALYLDQNQITGEIPAELGNLTLIEEFCLYSNLLTGSIPSELGNLVNATYFDIDLNQLSGSIPAELGNLASVKNLWLDNNLLTGEIPVELGNLSNIELLSLGDNQLTGSIPVELGDLSSLTTLYLNDNQLSGEIPSELGNLSSLKFLYLFNNKLSGAIPAELGNISTLIGLYIQINQLTGTIPLELGNLSSLVIINLRDNKLSGSIPAEIGNLSGLQYLYLYNNQLTGTIPTTLGSCSILQELQLNNNQLTGNIPAEIGSLSFLTRLSLSKNQLTGSIPVEIGNLTNLQYLYLYNNKFTNISDFSGLTSLIALQINENELTFGDLENVNINLSNPNYYYSPQAQLLEPTQTVSGDNIILSFTTDGTGNTYQWYKDNEAIAGETNDELTIANTEGGIFHCEISNSNFSELVLTTKALFINSSESHGVTEAEYDALVNFYNSTNGADWNNNTNWLSAEDVSNWFGVTVEAGHVKTIKFVKNGLTGTIPTSIEDLTYLENFDIQENGEGLTGSIPVEIGNLQNLTFLKLYNNSINGEIPSSLGSLSSLEYLSLSFNNLEGEIPTELGNLTNLYSISLDNNELQGNIPSEIGNMSGLEDLYLHYNQLTGEIPGNFANLENLVYLRFDDNKLTGLTDLSSLSNLQYLYIDENKFTFEDFDNTVIDFSTLTDVDYTPQENLVMINHYMYFSEGKSVSLNCVNLTTEELSGTNNKYAIYKDGSLIRDWSSDPNYSITSFAGSNAGDYAIQVKNTVYTDLILYSDTMTIGINNAPTDVDIANNSINENSVIGSLIGQLSTSDLDEGDSFTYTFVTGDGTNDADNSSFSIEGDTVKTATELDYETQSEYNIYVQTEDGEGLTYEKAFVINVLNTNEAPTNIDITNNSIDENSAIGSVIGQLSTSDIDDGDSFTYSFATGDGTNDVDNSSFTIEDNNLKTAVELNYETKSEYYIFIQTEDAAGLTYEKAFVINVNDLTETGLNNIDELKLSVYPNPSNGNFTLEFNANTYEVKVYDIVGNVIYKQISFSPKHDFNLSEIAKGTYFIKIQDNEKVLTKKIQIQ